MAPTRFGTDGVRGVANEELTPELALALGRAAARVLPAPTFVVGRDTRRSGPLLQAAFSAGLAAEGADVVDLGVLPTPGVAAVAESRQAPGAVISASHNPFGDNGIKLFSLLGTKLPVGGRGRDRARARRDPGRPGPPAPPPDRSRRGAHQRRPRRGATLYQAHLVATLEGRRLDGLRVVRRLRQRRGQRRSRRGCCAELGAQVTALHDAPDGANINDKCGSTDPSELARAVVAHQADLGLAFDGDADRVIAVDHDGTVVDGDVLLALFALDLAERGAAGRQHRGRHRHDQPRLPPGHGGPRHRACARPTWGTATSWPRSTPTGSAWAASSRATSSSGRARPPATAS